MQKSPLQTAEDRALQLQAECRRLEQNHQAAEAKLVVMRAQTMALLDAVGKRLRCPRCGADAWMAGTRFYNADASVHSCH